MDSLISEWSTLPTSGTDRPTFVCVFLLSPLILEFVAEHRAGMVFHDEVWRAIRSRRRKYTVKGDKHGGAPWQFFDLEEDPHELNNLIADPAYRDDLVRHHGYLCGSLQRTEDPFVLLAAFGHEGINLWD